MTSVRVILVNSICVPPALHSEMSTWPRCLPVAQCLSTAGEHLSTLAVTVRSGKLTLPAPAPPPLDMVLGWVAPQVKESMSVQPLWLESWDSPLAPSTFMNISTDIAHLSN